MVDIIYYLLLIYNSRQMIYYIQKGFYMRNNIFKLLQENPYPGRGIIIGCSEDGAHSVIVYFIMGRSENSRNRVFVKTDDGIRTTAFDPSKMTDPSLVIYHPVRVYDGVTIVTNGDQTDTISDFQKNEEGYYKALKTRTFEPDEPNYTPRISGMLWPCGAYALSVLKTAEGNPKQSLRQFNEYSCLIPGLGHFISTYKTDGDPLPSFEGEPVAIAINDSDGLEAFAKQIWTSLNEDNKVSLYAVRQNIKSKEIQEVIINKLEETS